MVNTRRTKFLKKKEGRSRVSQPQEKNDAGTAPTETSPPKHEVSLVSLLSKQIGDGSCLDDKYRFHKLKYKLKSLG